MSIHDTAKHFAKFAKQDNRLSEKFSRKYPKYYEWKDEQFLKVKGELITLIGRF